MQSSRWVRLAGTAYAVGGAMWVALALAMGVLYGGDPPPDWAAFVPSQLLWLLLQLLLLFGFFRLFGTPLVIAFGGSWPLAWAC